MGEGAKRRSDFSRHLLMLATRRGTHLNGLLQLVLERALALTGSDAGGGIFILETSSQEPALVASIVRGPLADSVAKLVKRWKHNPHSAALIVLQSGQPRRIDDHHQAAAGFPLLTGSRSSLWIPLLNGQQVMGVMGVESSQPRHYSDEQLRQLQGLAVRAVRAIDRLLLRDQMAQAGGPVDMVGVSPGFLELERQIKLAASVTTGPVLISGERGSGKELTAWAIHCWSDRRDKPFLPVLASGVAESLFADELFGHERQAFTGAAQQRGGEVSGRRGRDAVSGRGGGYALQSAVGAAAGDPVGRDSSCGSGPAAEGRCAGAGGDEPGSSRVDRAGTVSGRFV